MKMTRRAMLLGGSALCLGAMQPLEAAAQVVVDVATPMAPPEWALLERALLEQQTAACELFFDRYYDANTGFFRAVARWGANDGPDDAIENVNNWPQLYALGGDERIRQMYEKAYEGHVRQFSEARTTVVKQGRDGMYFKDFSTQMDWQHQSEGMTVFNVMGLGDPYNKKYRDRVRTFANFYTGEDKTAPNYDPKNKLIRSMMNGSRGPLMRKATGQDWAGDPIDLSGYDQTVILHGESTYEQMVAHYKDYNDIVGDNPLNLNSTTLAFNAYALANEPKYKAWIVEYADAWLDRARRNNDIVPTNIGLDGKIGGEAGGKWYGGVYGWSFSPINPVNGKREDRNRLPYSFIGWLSAYVVTGDDKYLDVWRRMADRINENARTVDGQLQAPTMYGDKGWYGYRPGRWQFAAQDIYMMSMKPADRARAPDHPYLLYIEGKNPDYPSTALKAALGNVRKKVEAIYADRSTASGRFMDTVMEENPATVSTLINLMEGGIHIGRPGWSSNSPNTGGSLHYARLRYFDPDKRRPGIPQDVAALVQSLTDDSATLTLVNVNPTQSRTVTIQGGAYGEHQILAVSQGNAMTSVNARALSVRLAPGAGAALRLQMKRYANPPTLNFPWPGPIVDQNLGRSPAA
jgi:hypothetical protein